MRKSSFLSVLFLTGWMWSPAQNTQTVETLTESIVVVDSYTDKEVVIPGKTELHITSASVPFTNSIVKLNSENAWVIFDNIRPQEVVNTLLQYVYVNDQLAIENSNVRVSIYKQGTVVIPHSSAIMPLTVFTGLDYSGNSQQFAVNTYYKALGDFNNQIRSFKLKRGYMATLATFPDGTGYSRCFIADDDDLEVSDLDDLLDQKVSFIRVFRWEYVSKKGWGGWNETEYNMVNATWHYDWNTGSQTDHITEYVPMRWNGGWPSWSDINAKQNVSHILGFNEPDHDDQANLTLNQMIAQWPEYMKNGLRIGSPAWANPWGGYGGTLFDFINRCDDLNYRVDFVALHCYWGGKAPINWYNDLKYIHEQTGRPLWITEWNNGANWTTEWWPSGSDHSLTTANAQKQLNDLMGILQVLDTASFVERYAIYNWVEDCRAMVLNGQLTPAGQYYANHAAPYAFNRRKEVIPSFHYSGAPVLSMATSGSTSAILSITDYGFEQQMGCVVEKKRDDGAYVVCFDSNDPTLMSFTDPIDLSVKSGVNYRVRVKLKGGGYSAYSNEVGYNVLGGSDFQFGNVSSSSLNWTPAFFKQTITSPVIVAGSPTSKNGTVLMSNRIKYGSSGMFYYQFAPWAYQNISSLTNSESISCIALNQGTYDLGGLKAIAARVSGIKSTWTDVTFATPFEDVPVVLVSQFFPATTYATAVRIRNVTKTGFQARLQRESKITGTLNSEIISYLAVEQGQGAYNDHTIIVGKTTGSVGSVYAYAINFNDSLYNAFVLPQMQTCNDDTVTATLRCLFYGAKTLSVKKQREVSLGYTATANNEVVGYVMIKPDVVSSVHPGAFNSNLTVYPIPVKTTLFVNVSEEEMGELQIFNMTGLMVRSVRLSENQLNVEDLPSGYYFLKTKGGRIAKFVKQ